MEFSKPGQPGVIGPHTPLAVPSGTANPVLGECLGRCPQVGRAHLCVDAALAGVLKGGDDQVAANDRGVGG